MFRRKKSRARNAPPPVDASSPQLREVPTPLAKVLARSVEGGTAIRFAALRPVGGTKQGDAGDGSAGECIAIYPLGRVIVTACGMPDPWSLEERTYTAYSCYLEEPGSGNRIRMDMVRAGDRHWVAVNQFSADLEGYGRACVFPSGDGLAGTPVLSGDLTAI